MILRKVKKLILSFLIYKKPKNLGLEIIFLEHKNGWNSLKILYYKWKYVSSISRSLFQGKI